MTTLNAYHLIPLFYCFGLPYCFLKTFFLIWLLLRFSLLYLAIRSIAIVSLNTIFLFLLLVFLFLSRDLLSALYQHHLFFNPWSLSLPFSPSSTSGAPITLILHIFDCISVVGYSLFCFFYSFFFSFVYFSLDNSAELSPASLTYLYLLLDSTCP